MRKIPILFSTPMVQAILAGRKSITRRMQGLEKINEKPDNYAYKGIHPDNPSVHIFARLFLGVWVETIYIKCPYGQPGDVLWVRESFKIVPPNMVFYKADECNNAKGWKPSIHMPKAAARIWLKVVNVRVERLQEITEQDAKAEGAQCGIFRYGPNVCKGEYHLEINRHADYTDGFKYVWHQINGRESWDSNPWVWVVELEVLSTTGRPCSI